MPQETFALTQRLIQLRAESHALRDGDFRFLIRPEHDDVFAYARGTEDDERVVVINAGQDRRHARGACAGDWPGGRGGGRRRLREHGHGPGTDGEHPARLTSRERTGTHLHIETLTTTTGLQSPYTHSDMTGAGLKVVAGRQPSSCSTRQRLTLASAPVSGFNATTMTEFGAKSSVSTMKLRVFRTFSPGFFLGIVKLA